MKTRTTDLGTSEPRRKGQDHTQKIEGSKMPEPVFKPKLFKPKAGKQMHGKLKQKVRNRRINEI